MVQVLLPCIVPHVENVPEPHQRRPGAYRISTAIVVDQTDPTLWTGLGLSLASHARGMETNFTPARVFFVMSKMKRPRPSRRARPRTSHGQMLLVLVKAPVSSRRPLGPQAWVSLTTQRHLGRRCIISLPAGDIPCDSRPGLKLFPLVQQMS
jgi:hypothetical protein